MMSILDIVASISGKLALTGCLGFGSTGFTYYGHSELMDGKYRALSSRWVFFICFL
jgi:hypothetical protein